jgi:hypothetical protein
LALGIYDLFCDTEIPIILQELLVPVIVPVGGFLSPLQDAQRGVDIRCWQQEYHMPKGSEGTIHACLLGLIGQDGMTATQLENTGGVVGKKADHHFGEELAPVGIPGPISLRRLNGVGEKRIEAKGFRIVAFQAVKRGERAFELCG